jgi:hypothetical protein
MTQKIKERTCPTCNGTGFPVVAQPTWPDRKIYPVKCRNASTSDAPDWAQSPALRDDWGKTAQISQGRHRFRRADGKWLGQHPSLDLP